MGLSLSRITNGEDTPRLEVRMTSGNERLALAAAQLREEFDLRMQIQQGRMWLQDSWFLTYLLVDAGQDQIVGQPERPKYYTPKAMNIVDTARRVLARNPLRYHVLEPHTGTSRDARENSRILENVYHGLMFDMDRQLLRRGESSARMAAAFQTLVRGQWAYKLHLTSKRKTSTGSPTHYQSLDPRLVLPGLDLDGMESSISWDYTTLAKLYYLYEPKIRPIVEGIVRANRDFGGNTDYSFLHQPLLQLEWTNREEAGLLLDLSGITEEYGEKFGATADEHSDRRYLWLREPWEHKFGMSLIQVGNVNGIPAGLASQEALQRYPSSGLIPTATSSNGGVVVSGQNLSNGPVHNHMPSAATLNSASVIDPAGAMMGRSILAPVAHLFSQFNDLMVLLKQGVQNEIRGTWTFKSRSGGLVDLRFGDGTVNPLQLNESLERVDPNIRAIDVVQVMQAIQEDINQGSLDLRFVLGSDFEGSGFLRQRMEQGALTSLADYEEGLANWGVSVADSFNTQDRAASGRFGDWKLFGRQPGAATHFFVIDVNDEVKDLLTNGEEPPMISAKTKVDVPIDMAARINMAKSAVDPNNPLMSLTQAIDLILELDDADQAYDNILQDIGNRNPTIQLVNIAAAFRRAGAGEVADMILGDQFRDAFNNEVTQGSTLTNKGAAQGTDPSAAPAEVTTGRGDVGTGQQ